MASRILITGVTGFVGSHMADFITRTQPEAEIYATRRWHLSKMDNVRHLQDRIRWVDCDLTDPVSTRIAFDKAAPDRVFHFAAESFVSPSWSSPHRYMAVNYNGTVNLLEAMRVAGSTARLLIPGSGEEYGEIEESELPIRETSVLRPVNPYAVTKIAQDLIGYVYFRSYGLNVIRTRAFNHEGPRRENVFGIPWYAYQIARVEAGLQEPELRVGHIDDRRQLHARRRHGRGLLDRDGEAAAGRAFFDRLGGRKRDPHLPCRARAAHRHVEDARHHLSHRCRVRAPDAGAASNRRHLALPQCHRLAAESAVREHSIRHARLLARAGRGEPSLNASSARA